MIMKRPEILILAGSLLAGLPALAQGVLTNEHTDVDVGYDPASKQWNLILHDETHDRELDPAITVVQVGPEAFRQAPAFFGGGVAYILPQIQDPNLVYLGTSGEDVDRGIFKNDEMTLTLKAIDGPGKFALYSVVGLGTTTVFMNTQDGVSAADRVIVPALGHTDYNWAFSQPGSYTLTFEGSGILNDGLNTPTVSEPVAYHFNVVPEPGTWALAGVGTLALWLTLRRRTA